MIEKESDMSTRLTIIGAGPGGYVAAIRAAQNGAEVTLIEKSKVGGVCLNWGCIPSKTMKHTAELLEKLKNPSEFGIRSDSPLKPDMALLKERKNRVVDILGKGIMGLLARNKIRYIDGRGRIDNPQHTEALLPDGARVDIPTDAVVIATGSKPTPLPGFPFDGRHILSSNDVFDLDEIPDSILIIGGGIIGCEFAFIFNALGATVTIVEAMPNILPIPSLDSDGVGVIAREMKKRKIRVLTNRSVKDIDEEHHRLAVRIGGSPFDPDGGDIAPETVDVEKVIVCIGRTVETGGIDFRKLGIKTDAKGWIITNDRMETHVPNMYAIGDVLGPEKMMLAHAASAEGIVAAENIAGKKKTMRYTIVPSVVFTMPEMAGVGLTESRAIHQGYNIRTETVLFRAVGKSHAIGEIQGQAKIIADKDKHTVLGVHIVGPRASDLIAEGALAVQTGARLEDIAHTIHAHPTLSEIMAETAEKILGKSIHG